MKNVNFFKKFIALVLAFTMALPNIAFASEGDEISLEGLRVSDEFAAKYPNGMFEVVSPLINTKEGNEFDFILVRRGGTQGDTAVDLKAIESIAKYGEDFVLLAQNSLGIYTELKKSEDSPTILESYIKENADMVLTSDRAVSDSGVEVVDLTASGSGVEVEKQTENTTKAIVTETTTEIEYSEDLGNYTSYLHKMRDEATGNASPANAENVENLDDVFEVRNAENIQASDEIVSSMKGLSYTVDFKDGEAYKIIKVKILNDKIYEAQEEFTLSLYNAAGGAVLGDSMSSNIFVEDDDEVEKCEINFQQSEITAFADDEGVMVKLIRSGNLNDYVNVNVSTLADTAKADQHYTPVVGEVMFMPGESEKKIFVPLLTKDTDINEPVYLDIKAETDDNAEIVVGSARIEIKPDSATANESLITISSDSNDNLISSSDETTVDAENVSLFRAAANSDNTVTLVGNRNISDSVNFWRWSERWYDGNVDLTGIDRITWNWSNAGVDASRYSSRQRTRVRFGDIQREKSKTFNKESASISSDEMKNNKMRTQNVYYKLSTYVSTDNKMNADFTDIKGHLTNFSFNAQTPDALTAYTYINANEIVPNSGVNFMPGRTSVNTGYFNRGDYITVTGELSDAGKQYGAEMTKYILTGNNKSITNSSSQYVSSDFISNYIYNGDQTRTTLSGKAIYERTKKVNKINIARYDDKMGSLKIGGVTYNNEYIKSDKWLKGDKIKIDVVANQGYNISKVSANGKEYNVGDTIPLEDNMEIKPLFQKDNNKVSITWDQLGTGVNEEYNENIKHGMVFHSLTDQYTNEQIEALNKDVPEVPKTGKEIYNLLDDSDKKQLYLSYVKYTEDLDIDTDLYKKIIEFYENDLPYEYKVMLEGGGIKTADVKEYYKYLSDDRLEVLKYYYLSDKTLDNSMINKAQSKAEESIKYKIYNGAQGFKIRLVSGGFLKKYICEYNGKSFEDSSYIDWLATLNVAGKVAKYIVAEDKFEHLSEVQKSSVLGKEFAKLDTTKLTDGIYLYYLNPDDFDSKELEEKFGLISFDDYIDKNMPLTYTNKATSKIKEDAETKRKENYKNNPNLFKTLDLKELSIGDVVTVFAAPDEGYTCLWAYTDKSSSEIKENEQVRQSLHVGDSFTFEVKDADAELNYYFEKSSNINQSAIITGRLVKSKSTLLKQSEFGVDIRNPNTFNPIVGVDVSTGSIDPTKSIVVDGTTYTASGQTDKNGYFSIYAPNAVNNLFASVVFSNGDKQYVKDALIKKNSANVTFEVPFMDENIRIISCDISNNTSGASRIDVADENRTVTVKASVKEGYAISRVVLRSYSSTGSLIKAVDMTGSLSNGFKTTFNAKEYLKDGGRLTVEAYDIYGTGKGEVETGYSFYEKPSAGNIKLPDMANLGGVEVPVVGNTIPGLSLGEYEGTPQAAESADTPQVTGSSASGMRTANSSDTTQGERFELAVLSGEMMKNEIKEAAKNGDDTFTTGTITERVNKMTSVIGSRSSTTNATQKEWGKEATKPKTKSKFATTGGKAALDVDLDIGFYLSMNKIKDDAGNTVYVFEQLYGLFGVQVDAKKDFGFAIGPVPVYVTIAGRIGVKGLVGIMPADGYEDKITIGGKDGWFSDTMNSYCYVDGVIGIFPYLSLGAGVGYRGVLSVGINGNMTMAIAYQPWKDGAGTVQFALNVDIDLAIIPITFSVASIKLGMFYTKDYQDNSWVDFSDISNKDKFSNYKDTRANYLRAATEINSEINNMPGEINSVARADGENIINEEITLFSAANDITENADPPVETKDAKSVRQGLKHPKPQIVSLSGDKQIMFYIGDDSSRDDYDCTAVYYTIYDGSNWSQPVILDDDGMYDGDYQATAIDNDRVMVVWSSSDKVFGNTLSDAKEYFNSMSLKYSIFSSDGVLTDTGVLTSDDDFANNMPRVSYDKSSGRIIIAYTVTDYSDAKVEFSYETIDDLNNFMNNAYSTVAYKILNNDLTEVSYGANEISYIRYEDNYGEGSLDNQRFAEILPANADTSSNINELSINSIDGKAYITYALDTDSNTNTTEDVEIFTTVINYSDNSSLGPVKITDNTVYDGNPQTVKYNDTVWLYWNYNSTVSYIDLDSVLNNHTVKSEQDGNTVYEVDQNIFVSEVKTAVSNTDAASTFTISLQPDGYVYLMWNQLDTFDDESVDIDENDIYGAEATKAYITKRSIYMKVYDPKYESEVVNDEEFGDRTIYNGKWGSAVRIDEPEQGDVNYSEQTFAAKSTDKAVAAFRRYTLEENENGGKSESDNSDLVIHNYRLVSTLDITDGDVYSYPEHPAENDTGVLHINVSNTGVLPSDTVTFTGYIEDDKGNKSELGTNTVNSHLSSNGKVEGTLNYTMPVDTEFVKFYITAWEDDVKENAVEYVYTINSGAELSMINSYVDRVDNDKAYYMGTLVNNGNLGTGKLNLKVGTVNDSMSNVISGEENQYNEIHNVELEGLEPGESREIKELLDISNIWGDENNSTLYVSIDGEKGNMYSEDITLRMFGNEELTATDIIVNNNESDTIDVNEGSSVGTKAKVVPEGASVSYRLEYSSKDPTIAEVDASSGEVTGLKPGNTKLVIKAIRNNYSFFVDENDVMHNPDGSVVEFDENGNPINLYEGEDGYVALTKEIDINVNSIGVVDSIEPETENITSDIEDETEAKHSSGAGSSQLIVKAAETTQATTINEIDTEETTMDTATEVKDTAFEDIKGLWAEEYINYLYEKGIVNGRSENIFAPFDNLTRAEFVMMLANATGENIDVYNTKTSPFADVSNDSWHKNVIVWGAENEIIYGTGNDKFSPDEYITREDVAAIMYRLLIEKDYNGDETESKYTDSTDISVYAQDAVNTLSELNVLKGYEDGSFKPKNNITRAEISSVFYNILSNEGGEMYE